MSCRVAVGAAAVLLVPLAPLTAAASPQGRAGVRPAVCGVGVERRLWQSTRFCGALTGDLLLGRSRNADFGIGPYVELGTAGFFDVRVGGGASLLVPVSPDFPLVASIGVYDHALREPALAATLFWGARSYNFGGAYNLGLGLFASASTDLGGDRATLVTLGADIDAFFLAAPFILLVSALR